MKAMILASGTGSRLGSVINDIPKCLVMIKDNKSILEMQLDHFSHYGIKDIIITTGPYSDKIHTLIYEKYCSLNVQFVYNEKYDSTNYIYSMFNCASLIDDDFILAHGDLVFESGLIEQLLESENSTVCLDRSIPLPEKDFKGIIVDGMVKRIGIDVSGKNIFFLAPLYKLKKHDFMLWMKKIGEFVNAGRVHEYAENAFNEISDQLSLFPLFYDGLFCREIDTPDDLKIVRNYYRNI